MNTSKRYKDMYLKTEYEICLVINLKRTGQERNQNGKRQV